MGNQKILIVDDDPKMVKLIQSNLKARGYNVFIASDGSEAIELVERELPDLILLDILMPEVDGYEVCKRIRQWADIPIIIISALGRVENKVACFNLGADDYINKPFAIDELLARIKAVLSRTQKFQGNNRDNALIKQGELEINLASGVISASGEIIRLTSIEYKIITEFALNQGKVLSHEYILNKVWGAQFQSEYEYLRVYISRLRKKLDPKNTGTTYIQTIPSIGYKFG
jgi:two-component system KDP operon response regulator KdpE